MTYTTILLIGVTLWLVYITLQYPTRTETARAPRTNLMKGVDHLKSVSPGDPIKRLAGTTPKKPKVPAGADAPGTSPWQKFDTVFGGLSLATLPLMFIPFGGGGGGDGGYGGSVLDDPNTSSGLMSSSSVSSSSSCLLLVVGVIAVVLMNEKK